MESVDIPARRQEVEELILKLASALLLVDGSLSISEIAAIPGVADRAQAVFIASRLLGIFDADTETRRLGSTGIWEPTVRLRSFESWRR